MEYILFIHKNATTSAAAEEWTAFFDEARTSGMFAGGSEIGNGIMLGKQHAPSITDSVGGFMRFDTEDKNALLRLLETHPVLVHAGTLELCEMPKS